MVRPITIAALALAHIVVGSSYVLAGQGAQTTKSVTNADVIAMSSAKLTDDVIIGAIQQSAHTEFDVSPAALIALRNAGVSDRVMQSMQFRVKEASSVGATATLDTEPCVGIFITEEEPPSRSYVVVKKEIQAGKKFYGSHDDNLMAELATQAQKAGADAIVKFHEWRAPSMWSWAAAKAGGMAVKWTAEGKASISAMKGQCWSPKARE